MAELQKVMYTTEVTSTGGRDGHSKSKDGVIDFKMGKPVELGGKGEGYNPEQLFAAGYSACFLGAMKAAAAKSGNTIPDDTSVTARVSFGTLVYGFGLAVELRISLPGMAADLAKGLVEKAHMLCPYSNATRNNVEVTLTVV